MSVDRQLSFLVGGVGLVCSVVIGCASDGMKAGSQGPATVGTPGTQVTQGAVPGASTAPTNTNTVMNPAAPTQPVNAGGTAGNGAAMPMPTASAGAAAPPVMGTTKMPVAGGPMTMGECGLHTKYAGDEYCILPPPADQGFQLHIGPSNYDNPESQYLLLAGQESTPTFSGVSGNDKQVYFYYRQIRQRPGSHHNIITSGGGGDSGLGQRIATSNRLAEDDPAGGVIAPENMDVGISMPAHTAISVSLHSINTTQATQLREVWVNFWYVDPSKVKEPVLETFAIAPMAAIAPGADVTFGSSCTSSGTGRVLWMYGHRHANNVRFTTWRLRGGKKELVYQAYNFEEPLVLDYSSTVTNPVADTGPNVEGGWSGILDLMPGDQLAFECHVINKTSGVLNFTNNTFTGEMCILDAETVGAGCN